MRFTAICAKNHTQENENNDMNQINNNNNNNNNTQILQQSLNNNNNTQILQQSLDDEIPLPLPLSPNNTETQPQIQNYDFQIESQTQNQQAQSYMQQQQQQIEMQQQFSMHPSFSHTNQLLYPQPQMSQPSYTQPQQQQKPNKRKKEKNIEDYRRMLECAIELQEKRGVAGGEALYTSNMVLFGSPQGAHNFRRTIYFLWLNGRRFADWDDHMLISKAVATIEKQDAPGQYWTLKEARKVEPPKAWKFSNTLLL